MQVGLCSSSACKLKWEAQSGFLYLIGVPGCKFGQYVIGSRKQKKSSLMQDLLVVGVARKGVLMLALHCKAGQLGTSCVLGRELVYMAAGRQTRVVWCGCFSHQRHKVPDTH